MVFGTQKVSICSALITNPKLLLVDEPMIGLDPKAIKNMKEVLVELNNPFSSINFLEIFTKNIDIKFVFLIAAGLLFFSAGAYNSSSDNSSIKCNCF